MGDGGAHLRNGCRLPALLRRPAHSDLREDRLREGMGNVAQDVVLIGLLPLSTGRDDVKD